MKKGSKVLKGLCASVIATGALTFHAMAGQWMQDEIGTWYLNDNGTYLCNEWYQENGDWYYFKEDGYVATGILQGKIGQYYMGKNGAMYKDRSVYLNGICYDTTSDGFMITTRKKDTWVQVDQGYLYLTKQGTILKNSWKIEGDAKYYLGSDGLMVTGWYHIDHAWYYFSETGVMQTGWITDDSGTYYLDEDGKMISDTTLEIDGTEYIIQADGKAEPVNNYKKPTYIAPDELKTESELQVAQMADTVLAGIVNDSMTKTEKARAIYAWVRKNFRYVNFSEKGDWVAAAYNGFRTKRGDCYTYYSVSLALLSRCGIPSIEMIRTDNHHWWNLIDCGYGWYHFDACPRSEGGVFCLLTDAEIQHHSDTIGEGSHEIDRSLYPETPVTPSPQK